MKELEEALGVQLFVRGNRQTLLTEEGVYLRARAQEMMQIPDVLARCAALSRARP